MESFLRPLFPWRWFKKGCCQLLLAKKCALSTGKRLGSMPRNSVVGLNHRLNMTIVVDWDVKPTTNQTKQKYKLLTFYKMTPSFSRSICTKVCGETPRKFAEFLGEFSRSFSAKSLGEKKNGLRELTRNLAEFSPRKFAFENFCSRCERENKAFFLGWSVNSHQQYFLGRSVSILSEHVKCFLFSIYT